MIRIAYILLRLFFSLPKYYFGVKKYARNKDKYPYEERYQFVRGICRHALRSCRTKPIITGIENIPKDGAFLMTPNHQGMYDILLMFEVMERPFKIIPKKELMDVVAVGDALRFLEFPAIDRENFRQAVKVIRQARKEMTEGIPYVIYPEGTRSKQGNTLLEFKSGTFRAGMDAKVPIVPAAIMNSFKVVEENNLKKVEVQLHFFEPIMPEDYANMKSDELALKVHDQIQSYINEHA